MFSLYKDTYKTLDPNRDHNLNKLGGKPLRDATKQIDIVQPDSSSTDDAISTVGSV